MGYGSFGEDMEMVPLNGNPNQHTCFRHLYCLRYNVDYTSLPLGTKAFRTLIVKVCHEDLTRQAEMHGWTATDIAKTLQEENDKHVWPRQLPSKKGQAKLDVEWTALSEEFADFSMLRCLRAFS